MSKSTPYFSFNGLAFQTPGDEVERHMNLKIAMARLERYVLGKGQQDEAMTALAFIEDLRPSLESLCDDIRIAFLLDDFEDYDLKQRFIRRAYNRIVDRLNGVPLR